MRNIFKGKVNGALLIIRIIVGIIFLAHGIAKFNTGIDATAGFFENIGIPAAGLMAWVVTLIETFGGAALIFGIGTELAAALLIMVMIGAMITVKFGMGLIGGYELDLGLIAALIPLLVQGAGKYSLSYIVRKMNREPQAQY